MHTKCHANGVLGKAGPRVLVVGAGAGAFAALALARQGAAVTLADRNRGLMLGASGRNGRRLHLGEHYSEDAVGPKDLVTLSTGRLCFLGAVQLARNFQVADHDARWWQFLPPDSMTPPDAYEKHLAGLSAFHRSLANFDPAVDRLFGPPGARHRKLRTTEFRAVVPPASAVAGYASREPVINLGALRHELAAGLASTEPQVRMRLGTEIVAVRTAPTGYVVRFRDIQTGTTRTERFDWVVNATWHEIPRLAQMVSSAPMPDTTVRLKLLVTTSLPSQVSRLPSFYFHRGVYGSHTNVNERMAIVTAEAVSNLSFSTLSDVPRAWLDLVTGGLRSRSGVDALQQILAAQPSHAGTTGDGRARDAVHAAITDATTSGAAGPDQARWRLGMRVVESYRDLVPAFRAAEPTTVKFVTVLSSGAANLADPRSPVHRRSFHVHEIAPGFFNFDPGKLSLAQLAADWLCVIAFTPSASTFKALDRHVLGLLGLMLDSLGGRKRDEHGRN